jgi:multidrug transporter EmrE-like cation transporter
MWFRLMMAAFAFNGLCTFGLRILTGWGLASAYTLHYLVFWYLGGALIMLLLSMRSLGSLRWQELAIGGALGTCSGLGQSFIGMALGAGLPGNVVFPVCLAGGLFIVVLAGVTIFRERVGPVGLLGIVLGIVSIALLSLE